MLMYIHDIKNTPVENLRKEQHGVVKDTIHSWDTGALIAFAIKKGWIGSTQFVHGDEIVDISKEHILCKNRVYKDHGKQQGSSVLGLQVFTNDWSTCIGRVTDAAFDTDTLALYHLEMLGSSGPIKGKRMLIPRNHILEINKKGVHVDHIDQLEPAEAETREEELLAQDITPAMHIEDR